ncbi:MAG: hypothetical protein K2K85_02040 [Clostridia bacterium]|nr:hypothetical protein [Clostridia bacterium]
MFSLCDQAVIQYGVDPLIVGEYTPYELLLLSKQKAAREQKDFENDLCLAWHTEAFARQKKLPSLEKVLKDSRKKPSKKKNNKSDAILRAMAAEKGVKI